MEIKETKTFQKQIQKTLHHVKVKYVLWRMTVVNEGYEVAKNQQTWRDHPLSGDRVGQRSIVLGGKWRAIYEIKHDEVTFIEMQELTPHDY